MTILLLLIPISLLMLAGSIWAFIWAVRKGQFEDMDTPAIDILRDDEHERPHPAPASPDAEPSGSEAERTEANRTEPSRPEPSRSEPGGPAATANSGRPRPIDTTPAGENRPPDRAD